MAFELIARTGLIALPNIQARLMAAAGHSVDFGKLLRTLSGYDEQGMLLQAATMNLCTI